MIVIQSSNIKFDETEFNDFQNKLGATLPNDYSKFLEKNNGGSPELNVVEIPNEEIKSFSVTDFFGINNEKIIDLKSQYETYKKRIPVGYVPICRVEGGNIVCLSIHNGSISLWDHDTELLNDDVKSINSLLPIARSFEEFLKLMKPYEQEDDLDDYKVEDVWIDPDFLKGLKNDID